jgi:hypothetical protein
MELLVETPVDHGSPSTNHCADPAALEGLPHAGSTLVTPYQSLTGRHTE